MCFRSLLLINCLNWFYLKHDNWGFFQTQQVNHRARLRVREWLKVRQSRQTRVLKALLVNRSCFFCFLWGFFVFFFKYQLTVSIHLWWEIVHLLLYRYQTLSCRLLCVLREMQVHSYSYCRIKQNIDESFISKRAWWAGPFFTLYLLPLDEEL